MHSDMLKWLTDMQNPSVAYRTLRELQDKDEQDTEMIHAL